MNKNYFDENGELKHPKLIELENMFAVMERTGRWDMDIPEGMSDLERIGYEIRTDQVDRVVEELGLQPVPTQYSAGNWEKPSEGLVAVVGEGELEFSDSSKKGILQDREADYVHTLNPNEVMVIDTERVMVRGGPVTMYRT